MTISFSTKLASPAAVALAAVQLHRQPLALVREVVGLHLVKRLGLQTNAYKLQQQLLDLEKAKREGTEDGSSGWSEEGSDAGDKNGGSHIARAHVRMGYKIAYITDIEGNWDYFLKWLALNIGDNKAFSVKLCFGDTGIFLKNTIDGWNDLSSKLNFDQDGKPLFKLVLNSGWSFIHGGDAVDKGGKIGGSIRVVNTLLHLKENHSNHVTLLLGNRDLNKMRLTSEVFPLTAAEFNGLSSEEKMRLTSEVVPTTEAEFNGLSSKEKMRLTLQVFSLIDAEFNGLSSAEFNDLHLSILSSAEFMSRPPPYWAPSEPSPAAYFQMMKLSDKIKSLVDEIGSPNANLRLLASSIAKREQEEKIPNKSSILGLEYYKIKSTNHKLLERKHNKYDHILVDEEYHEIENNENSYLLDWINSMNFKKFKMLMTFSQKYPDFALSEAEIETCKSRLISDYEKLTYILKHTMGADGELERRREEIALLNNYSPASKVTNDDVAESFKKSVERGGFMFEYIQKGELATIENKTLFVHGGIVMNGSKDQDIIGMVPGPGRQIKTTDWLAPLYPCVKQSIGIAKHIGGDVDTWVEQLNEWKNEQVKAWIDKRTGEEGNLTETGSRGGDDLMDYALPTHKASVVTARHLAVNGMPQPLSSVTVARIRRGDKIRRLIVGHTPHGCAPTVVKQSNESSFPLFRPSRTRSINSEVELVMVDTSYSDQTSLDQRGDAVSVVTIHPEGHVPIRGIATLNKSGESKPKSYNISYKLKSLDGSATDHNHDVEDCIGRFESDYIRFVKAKIQTDDGEEALLMCKHEGYKIEYEILLLRDYHFTINESDGSVKVDRKGWNLARTVHTYTRIIFNAFSEPAELYHNAFDDEPHYEEEDEEKDLAV